MKWLYCINSGNDLQDILWGFLENHCEIEHLNYNLKIEACGEVRRKEAELVSKAIRASHCDGALSWNYCPSVSDACEECGIPYAAWLYDAPEIYVYASNMLNSCNYIFVFDRCFYEDLKKKGANAYYLPLAANTTRLGAIDITEEDLEKYRGDISFVGSLYDHHNYNQLEALMAPEFREVMNKVFDLAKDNWTEDILYRTISPAAIEYMHRLFPLIQGQDYPYISTEDLYVGLIITRKMAQIERGYVLNTLAEYFETVLYNSKDSTGNLRGVVLRPGTEYEHETPKVYFASKINLNLTMRSIRSGLPLRIFEITGVGGFLMSNRQAEFPELFEPEKEVVLFSSTEELVDKCRFYLTHEKERLRIAMAGYQRTMKDHTMKQRAVAIMNTVFPDRQNK